MRSSKNGQSASLYDVWLLFQKEKLGLLAPKTQANYSAAASLIPSSSKVVGDYSVSDISKILSQLSPGAYMVTRGFLSSLFSFAIRRGLAANNPVSGTETRKLGNARRWPRELVYRAIEKVPDKEVALVLEVMYASGQRLSDVLLFKGGDISDGSATIIQKKTGNQVTFPVSEEMTNKLIAVEPNPDKPFFKVKASKVWYEWRKIRDGLGMSAYKPHGLRKAASCEAAEGGASEAELQAMLGHKTVRAATLYRLEADRKLLAASAMSKRSL